MPASDVIRAIRKALRDIWADDSQKSPVLSRLLEVVRGAGRGFAVGYGYKVLVSVAFAMIKRRFWKYGVMRFLKSQEALRFGKFLALMVFFYRGTVNVLDSHKDKIQDFIDSLNGYRNVPKLLLRPKRNTASGNHNKNADANDAEKEEDETKIEMSKEEQHHHHPNPEDEQRQLQPGCPHSFRLLPLNQEEEEKKFHNYDSNKKSTKSKRETTEPWIACAGGFMAGAGLLVMGPEERYTYALYVLWRAIADGYNFLTECKGILPSIPHGSIVAFTLINGPVVYGLQRDPHIMAKGYLRWCTGIFRLGIFDQSFWTGATDVNGNPVLSVAAAASSSISSLSSSWQPCQCTLHPGMSCTEHFLRAWLFRSSVESAKFYFRIHVLSAILRLNQIYKGPMSFIASKLMTFGKSVLFLSTYAASSMYSTCLIRNAIKSDIPLTSIISGFVAGSSIMLEDRKRRKELTLYVLPRSWEILVNAYLKYIGGENSFISRYSTAINIFAFQCAMAILMYLIHREGFRGLNSLNHGLITAIWGVTPPSRPKRKKKKKRMAEGEKVEEDDKRTTTATLPVSIRKNEDENISVEYNHPSTQKPQPQLEENNLDHACSTDNKKGPNVVSPPHVVRSIQN